MMTPKVQDQHKARPAYVYLRQSSMGQVRHHRESTERQYAFKDKALELGWSAQNIRILDRDLGVSGTQMAGREDFKTLVADVSMGRVGAVFALEASRLARSCLDWHRLLELCALTDTLIVDEDGCYNPADFNDELLLGLKGTMSQAELHFLRARLLGGKLNKAKKGELKFPLPVGLCYDEEGRIVLDPDEQVRGAIRLLFDAFRQTGTAYAVVQKFVRDQVTFPKRAYGGVWDGRLLWGRLTHSRVLGVLRNPSYAGVYVFGRYGYAREISPQGEVRNRMVRRPMSSWKVHIPNHHEAYISWDEFLKNQEILEQNRTMTEDTVLSGPAREGMALLQGLLLCARCGRRLSVRYQGNAGLYPTYDCNWLRREGLSTTSCLNVRSDLLDAAVSKRVLEVLEPSHLEIAIGVLGELERRDEGMSRQWRMRLERAQYEAELAQRRYEEVDPSNRLVATTLEHRWNEALKKLEEQRKEFENYQRTQLRAATSEQKARVLALAEDLPRLWNAPTTQAKDRKRMLRLLLKDITVQRGGEPKNILLHLRWQGGATEDLAVRLRPAACDQVRYPQETIDKIRALAVTLTDVEIVQALNKEGCLPSKGKSFTLPMIKWIRYKHEIPAPQLKRLEELTVEEVARRFGVSTGVIYYWIDREVLKARRINRGSPCWITLDPQKEKELREWVHNSTKIQKAKKRQSEGLL